VQFASQSRSNADADSSAPVAVMPQSPARQAGPTEIVLTPKEREIHENGLVPVLKQIHDELDVAVIGCMEQSGTHYLQEGGRYVSLRCTYPTWIRQHGRQEGPYSPRFSGVNWPSAMGMMPANRPLMI
jgi:hypothetical protein